MSRLVTVLASSLLFAVAPHPPNDSTEWVPHPTPHENSTITHITASNAAKLAVTWRMALPEASDGSPLFLNNVLAGNTRRDLLIVETPAGRVVAVDAKHGNIVWQTTPPNGPRWTTSSPVVDPQRRYVFAYGLDGSIHRYSIADGREVDGGGWPELVTLKPEVEKGSSAMSIARAADGVTYLYMTTAAYPDPGDAGDYQGHLVAINLDTGEQNVFNALCSDRAFHFSHQPGNNCANVQSGIWARAGAVYDPLLDRLFITTGNGVYDADRGGFNWGSSVVGLRPDGTTDRGTPVDSYTPADYQRLTDEDLDLSSTTVVPLPVTNAEWPRLAVQSGKDGRIRLLNLEDLSGQGGPRHLGGELQIINVPQGGEVLTHPAVWVDRKHVWVFIANGRGTSALELTRDGNGDPQLVERWTTTDRGTSPIIVDDVMYIVRPHQIRAVRPTTGRILWSDDSIGDTHWQTPIVVDGVVYICDNAGYLTAYSQHEE